MNSQPRLVYGAPIQGGRNLPVQTPEPLFGRDADLHAVHLALKAGTAVLLHGPVGVGKTALIAALAAGYAELPGGVLWLDVARDSLRSLLIRVARAYGADAVRYDSEPDQQIALVRGLLYDNRPLIVLDGELQLEATREFVRGCAGGVPLLLTLTSLAPGSWTPYAVEPLPLPEAKNMLVRWAGLSAETELPDLDRLNQALRGYPLAVILAARQLAAGHSPADFLARMPGEFDPVLGALMATYRLLPPTLQGMVLMVGTAFGGGVTEALLAQAAGAPLEVIRPPLDRLVEYGLVARHTAFESTIFTAHESVQAFAHTFLRGKQQLGVMQSRHWRGLLAYLRQWRSEEGAVSYAGFAAVLPAILAAGAQAAQAERDGDLAELIELVTSVAPENFAQEFAQEIDWLRYLVDHPKAVTDGPLAMPLSAALPQAGPEATPDLAVPVPDAVPIGEPVAAIQETVEAVEIAEPEEFELAVQEQDTAPGPAVRQWEFAELEEPETVSSSTSSSTELAAASFGGLLSEETSVPSQPLGSFQADGSIQDELAALQDLARQSLEQARYDDALKYVEEGMNLAQQIDNPQREGDLLALLGDMQMMLGRLEGAEVAYTEAISAYRPCEDWLDIGLTLEKLGTLYLEQARHQDALTVLEQTIPIFERVERPDCLSSALDKLSMVYAELLNWDKALAYQNQALELARRLDDQVGACTYLSHLAMLWEASGSRERALETYRRALDVAIALGDAERQGHILLALGRMLIDDTPQLQRAIQLLEAAHTALPADTEIQRLLGRAKTRLERLTNAGLTLLLPEDSVEEYARAAATKQGQ